MPKATLATCSIPGCNDRVFARGWCNSHYLKWHRHGDPLHGRFQTTTAEARFWAKVDKDGPVPACRPDLGPCWLWTASLLWDGYGHFRDGDKIVRSHRFSYTLCRGPIPDGLTLDHLCQNPCCVNPAHLEPVTDKVNVLRGSCPPAVNARKTHCKAGHPLTPENTRLYKGGRYCRECRRANGRAYWHRKKLKADRR